jgi:ATP-dependent exoDNAse (exonuclease V) beta subunit
MTPIKGRSSPGQAPPDGEARARALDPARSFIVQAPAGSGKTELLIQRYLVLLGTVEHPEEIVAITFTRKAAAEMRARVLGALAAGRAQDRWELAVNPARLRIQTIDALCAALTRQMPLLSRFGAPPETVEDASDLYLEAARATLELVESDAEVARDVERLLLHLDNDVGRIEALLAGMLEKRDHWVRHLKHIDRAGLEAALAGVREQAVARAHRLARATDLVAIANYAFANLGRGKFDASEAESWARLAGILLTREDGLRARLTKNEGFPADKPGDEWKKRAAALFESLGENLAEALADWKRLPPARYAEPQWEALDAIARLLPHALAQLKVVFQSRGEVDFTEVAQGALAALGAEDAPTDLALALDYRIRHLLVDEFQDTSISQYELIARLTAGWQGGPDGGDGRTVFAVGDPMQSIYRFREAEVGEFLKTWENRRLGNVEVEAVRLAANFRSQAGVIAWVNDAFARIFPAREDPASGAVPYTASSAVNEALPGAAVEVHPFFDSDQDGEAHKVAELVAEARAKDPGSTIAILVRTRSHLADIVPRLKDAGLRFRAIEIDALGERPVVQDLLALTRALAHPADRVAWLAVLRAPWCGLTLADLCALAEGDDVRAVWESMQDDSKLSADGRRRLAQTREVLGAAIGKRLRGTLRDAVEGAWLALGGPACVEDATDLEDAGIYLDALGEAERSGSLPDLAAFEERLEKLWALPDARAQANDVQIMTIHKSKGLEFDHVIVPGLGRAPRSDDKRLFLWIERAGRGAPELLVAPIEEAGADDDPIYAWLRKLDAERAGHEAARLLYVAATRAKKRLHLLGDVRIEGEGDAAAPRKPNSATLLAKLWPAVEGKFRAAAALAEAREKKPEVRQLPNQDLVRLTSGWRSPEPPAAVSWQAPVEEARVQDAIEFSWAGETARHVGTVVHRWLQRIAEDELNGWSAERVERLRETFGRQLEDRGVQAAEISEAAARVIDALKKTLADERGRWLLGPQREAKSEYRLSAVGKEGLRSYVIDRVFVDENGERWIVDWKTSRHEGAEIEAFLDRERERYRGQMEKYREVLGGGRCGLYFPLHGGWREI